MVHWETPLEAPFERLRGALEANEAPRRQELELLCTTGFHVIVARATTVLIFWLSSKAIEICRLCTK